MYLISFLIVIAVFGCKKKDRVKGHDGQLVLLDSPGMMKKMEYYPDGALKKIETLMNDTLHGFSYSFHKNGFLSDLIQYEKGRKIHKRYRYDLNGKPIYFRYYEDQELLVYLRDYKQGKLLREEGHPLIVKAVDYYEGVRDSVIIKIKTIVPPDFDYSLTDIEVTDKFGLVLDTLQYTNIEEKYYSVLASDSLTNVFNITAILYKEVGDSMSVTQFEISEKDLIENKHIGIILTED